MFIYLWTYILKSPCPPPWLGLVLTVLPSRSVELTALTLQVRFVDRVDRPCWFSWPCWQVVKAYWVDRSLLDLSSFGYVIFGIVILQMCPFQICHFHISPVQNCACLELSFQIYCFFWTLLVIIVVPQIVPIQCCPLASAFSSFVLFRCLHCQICSFQISWLCSFLALSFWGFSFRWL